MAQAIVLVAPLQGWCAPLEETPDAVFAGRMLGDGVLIDPIDNVVRAPCDGDIVSVPASRHAVVIRSLEGAEILIHVGVDTVTLQGEGFTAHVAIGDTVRAGQPLLSFDPDLLASRGRSLLTPVVISNAQEFEITARTLHAMLEADAPLMELVRQAANQASDAGYAVDTVTLRIGVAHEDGVHARPAAVIAAAAKEFAAEITACAHGRTANARSAVGWMSLGLRKGDEVELQGVGSDAQAALAALGELLRHSGVSHPDLPPARVAVAKTTALQKAPAANAAGAHKLNGLIASRGFAIGHAVCLEQAEIAVEEAGRGAEHEGAALERAREQVRAQLRLLASGADSVARSVLSAHLEFIDDWELVAAARRSIAAGKSAAYGWRRAVRDSADLLLDLGDERLAERVADLLDVESQVLHALNPVAATAAAGMLPEHAIIIARDLKPSQFIALDTTRLAGICMAAGGATSHVAILAASAGVPVLVALGPEVLKVKNATWLMLDAEQGVLHIAPSAAERAAAEHFVTRSRQRRAVERSNAHQDCYTSDGTRIGVHANLGSQADAVTAAQQGAEGCGLLRTEFLFLERATAPDENEQLQLYQAIATTLAGRPLVIRTLDSGGDKPIPYLPLPAEENPALGLRGIRTSLWQRELLRTQLRAILRVEPAQQCKVLLPMITDIAEIEAVRAMVEELSRQLGRNAPIALGAMIETPAAALLAAEIAARVDFVSIGTNDLTQYTLAMDRGHAALAARIDALHPAVLRLMASCISSAREQECPVTICGGIASDPAAVPLLLGLGVRELSVVPGLVPQHKALLRTLSINSCNSLARQALQLESSQAVRALLLEFDPAVARFDKLRVPTCR